MNYIKLTIQTKPEDQDLIIFNLAELGFEGFEQKEKDVEAYIAENQFDEQATKEVLQPFEASFETAIMQPQNWNEVWESNFDPVVVDDFVGIRAHFHHPINQVQFELLITPKMSFGTGHHATTYMMVQQMRNLDFAGKKIFDFGTGTGILAILAHKLGATSVYAIDNDEWSIDNSIENAENNDAASVRFELANSAEGNKQYDIILANINKNVILQNIQFLSNQLIKGGDLLLSGLLAEDETDIIAACNRYELQHISNHNRNQWICIHLKNA